MPETLSRIRKGNMHFVKFLDYNQFFSGDELLVLP